MKPKKKRERGNKTKNPAPFIALILLFTFSTVKADLVFDSGYNTYDESDGYNFEVWVINDAALDVLGGSMGKLELTDLATANLYGGDIDWLWTNNDSVVSIQSGNINVLAAYEDSLVYLYAYDVIYHPTGGGEYGNREWIEGTYYSDNTPFNFILYTDQVYSHITVVPEPATILLLALGAIVLRKRY
jgi:hypothetical protein